MSSIVTDGVGPVALPAGWDDEDMEVITDGVRNFRIPWVRRTRVL